MKRKFVALVAVMALTACSIIDVRAANPAQNSSAADLVTRLPQADAVMFIDVRRLLSETLPVTLAEHPDLNRQVEAAISHLSGLGLDMREVDSLAVGFRFTPSPVMTGLVRGRFDANRVAAAAIRNAQRQTLDGRVFYTDRGTREVWAIVALDANTVALGEIGFVRAGVEAFEGRGRVESQFVADATRDANSLIGFTARVPSSLAQSFGGNNDELTRSLAAIRQVSGSFAPTESGGGELRLRVRAENAAKAAELAALLQSLKDTAAQFTGSPTAGTSVALPGFGLIVSSSLIALIRDFNIATEANEVSINASFTQRQISELLRAFAAPHPPPPAPQGSRP